MTPTARLSRVTLAATLALVGIGGFTRGSGSGYGCADRWPLCENGALRGWLPRWEYHMVIEWLHRWAAAMVGALVLVTLASAWRHHRSRPYVPRLAAGALAVVMAQAWIGRSVVKADLDADLVVLHLAVSMVVIALLTLLSVALWPRLPESSPVIESRSWTTHLAIAAAGAYALLLLGGYAHNRYFPGWPLVSDALIPDFSDRYLAVHWLHRAGAGVGLIYLGWVLVTARRLGRPADERRLLHLAAGAYGLNVGLGAVHVFTEVSSESVVTAHLMGSALVWTALVATTARSRTGMVAPSGRMEL
ncbi:MAG: COX15/CtaA family protein [Actinomycetota bacterium]|nr:COX15/CtaA family protein [Actinomycetota bacterium]